MRILTAEEVSSIRSGGPDAPHPGGLGLYGDRAREVLDSHESLRQRVADLEHALEELTNFRARAEDAARKFVGSAPESVMDALANGPEVCGGIDVDADDMALERDDAFLSGYDVGFCAG